MCVTGTQQHSLPGGIADGEASPQALAQALEGVPGAKEQRKAGHAPAPALYVVKGGEQVVDEAHTQPASGQSG